VNVDNLNVENRPTLLIVDDDHVSLNLLSKLVERLNYNAIRAVNGHQAWEILQDNPVDLIVTDYDMPGITGLEFLKKVKAGFARIPVILVTAYSDLAVLREAWECGAFDFFQKPVFVDRLDQTIRLAIEYGHLSIARRKFSRDETGEPDPDLINIGVVRELAVALDRDDLLQIVEEYETHARIELEQIIRHSCATNSAQVKSLAHRLAGTSMNLGLIKFADTLRAVEKRPDIPIPGGLDFTLEKSIFWLRNSLTQIFQNKAG
jgi:CheY-like chemotaxis protein